MKSWRQVWRTAVKIRREDGSLFLSDSGLKALARALASDDPRLLQGATTSPPPLQCVQDWPVEATCLFGYPFAADHGGFYDADGSDAPTVATVGAVEEHFAQMCYEIDAALGEPAGSRWLLNWFDETPRDEMRCQLLAEVNRTLAERRKEAG